MKKLSLAMFCSLVAACGGSSTSSETTPGDRPAESAPAPTADIIDTAIGAGSFQTLVAAVQAAGLVDTLKGDGPFTVFAPTDDAFAKLPEGSVEALLADRAALTSVLTYHVVSGSVTAADVAGLTEATTLQGSAIAIDTRDGVRINDATVITADVMASNGVIHVIDTVLLPAE